MSQMLSNYNCMIKEIIIGLSEYAGDSCGIRALSLLLWIIIRCVMAVLAPSHSPQDSDTHPSPSYSPCK